MIGQFEYLIPCRWKVAPALMMIRMWDHRLKLDCPGLFITGTDTEVGKTVVGCAIAATLPTQQRGLEVGVCKPLSSDCRRTREGLVNSDSEALAHFADCRQPLDVINPIRFHRPLAPAVAAEESGQVPDWAKMGRCLERISQSGDVLLVEGVGGLLVPIDPANPQRTVLDLIQAINYPTVVVARAGLGTLNHTAMTVRLIRQAGEVVAGIVINGHDPDAAAGADLSMSTNRQWLEKMTGCRVLAVLPKLKPPQVRPDRGMVPPAILDALAQTYWPDICRDQRH